MRIIKYIILLIFISCSNKGHVITGKYVVKERYYIININFNE